ncbi:outer membrane beta-barrel protein [Isoalcanivorax beigongshangi]|uniref:Outer membrane beta-barrel protein n=1 Tax=Isoalcanivorax beigongshangi TaxID=3238810 RepID=A0ABV4AEJ8_9GAMM
MRNLMRPLSAAALLLTATSVPMLASADTGYVSLGYAFTDLEPKHSRSNADVSTLQFTFGGWANRSQTLGAEVRLGLGLSNDKFRDNSGQRGKAEIDRSYGAYLRGQFPNTLPVRPYAVLGVTRVETTEKVARSRSRSYHDLSLGFGAELDVSHNVFVSLEYMRLIDRSSAEVSNLTFGVGGRF